MRYFADNRFLEYDNRKAVWETVSALPGGAPQQPPQTPIWFIPLTLMCTPKVGRLIIDIYVF